MHPALPPWKAAPYWPMIPLALYVDTFEEVDSSFRHAVENGAEPVLEPTTEPWGQRTCYVADPEGNLIEIGSWNKPYEEKDQ